MIVLQHLPRFLDIKTIFRTDAPRQIQNPIEICSAHRVLRKPGYDPCELFVDPAIRFPKVKIGATLLRKALGFRYVMDVIPLEPSLVKGSHGRPADRRDQGPLLMSTEPKLLPASEVDATEVFGLLLDHVFAE